MDHGCRAGMLSTLSQRNSKLQESENGWSSTKNGTGFSPNNSRLNLNLFMFFRISNLFSSKAYKMQYAAKMMNWVHIIRVLNNL